MPDETVVIKYEADTTGYAAGARRVARDLDALTAKAARAEAMTARAARGEARRGLAGVARAAGSGGIGDLVGGAGANAAVSGALIGAYGVRRIVQSAQEADPELAKLGKGIGDLVGPSARTNEVLIRLGASLGVVASIVKNVFATAIAGVVTVLTAAAGVISTVWGNVASFFGMKKIGSRLQAGGADLLAQAYNDITGGSGRGDVLDMEKKLEEAVNRRKQRDAAEKANRAGKSPNNLSGDGGSGFQSSAGLYVTSGGALMANQSLAIQRSMLQELQRITRETQNVRSTLQETAYGS